MRLSTRVVFLLVITAALTMAGCTSTTGDDDRPGGGGQVAAVCAAPLVEPLPDPVAPDQTIAITGSGWGPCNDTPNDAPSRPWPSVTVEWVQDDEIKDLGTIDVRNGDFSEAVTIPPDAQGGNALLRVAGQDYELEITVAVLPSQ